YSIYLWHWPVLVFFRYWSLGEMTLLNTLGLMALSLGIAIISWCLVEQPVRKKAVFVSWRAMASFSIVVLICCASAGATAYLTDGFASRMSPELLRYADTGREKSCQIEMNGKDVR
ncbi:MAG: acyltransferase, partial [Chthoniobacterales bacterium]|nr:acyltransferase [Chthoniobacterales bacterium]